MTRAVIFDMYETLITHYHSPLYFGTQMAKDAGIHTEIIPMLLALKKRGLLIGLISNCFSEEADVIRKSELFSRFDAVYLSYEQGIQKPDEEIFQRCMDGLSVKAEECIYVGDGGSNELEAARKLGMKAVQAAWYLQEGTTQPSKRKHDFLQIEKPLDVVKYVDMLAIRVDSD